MALTEEYGIPLSLLPADTRFHMEVERAPEAAGAPDTGAAVIRGVFPGTQEVLVDHLPNDGLGRWYRSRHVLDGWTASAWTEWFRAVPQRLYAQYKRIPWTPYTTPVVREETSTVRVITLTATPETATIRFRENGGKWIEAVGTITLRRVVTSSLTLEFYAILDGVEETLQKAHLDADEEPTIYGGNATENPAGYVDLDLDLDIDGDVVSWSVWARRVDAGAVAGWPRQSGQDNPDDDFLKLYRSTDLTGRFNFPGSNGDWYLIVRAYGHKGQWVEWTKKVSVAGTSTAQGALSNVQAAVSGANTRLTWDTNAEVEAGGHTVVVSEDDVDVVTQSANRDARTDAGSSSGVGVANVGGVDIAKDWVASGTAGAVQKTRKYVIKLYNAGAFVTSYPVSLTGWVDGSAGTAPTDTPGTPKQPTLGPAYADTSWTNTRTDLALEISWDYYVGEDGVETSTERRSQQYSLAAGTNMDRMDETSLPVGWVVKDARARVRYTNASGAGPWSSWSPWAIG